MVVNIGETLNQGQLGDVIYGFAHAQRGSNKFWDYIMNLYNNLDQNQNINTDLLVLKSLIVVEIHNKEFYDNKVQGILEKKALEENVRKGQFPPFLSIFSTFKNTATKISAIL